MSSHESLAVLTRNINWLRLWDDARDYGIQGARALESTLRTITIPIIEEFSSCHLCGYRYFKGHPPAEHIMEAHLSCDLVELLEDPCEETFTVATTLMSVTYRIIGHSYLFIAYCFIASLVTLFTCCISLAG